MILPHDKVSRRHALIHAQEHGRFCFVFRMEKLAGSLHALHLNLLLSAEARRALENEFTWIEAGRHPLPGFDGDFSFSVPR